MKKISVSSSITLIILMLVSCGKPLPTFNHIDLPSWTNDKNGCDGKRSAMLTSLDKQKDNLLGLSESQIVDLLGKPDETTLHKRNQKFYYYYLQPAADCPSHVDNPQKLFIRFTAMGIAKEVSIES